MPFSLSSRSRPFEHVGRGDVDVGDGLALQHDPARLPRPHELADLLAEDAGVGEEQRRLPAVDHDARGLLGLGVAFDVVPALEVADVAQHGALGPPAAAEEQQDREDGGDEDALQHAEEDHAHGGDEREGEGGLAHAVEAAEGREVHQRDRGHDDDRGQRRLRQVGEQPRQQEEQQDDHAGADEAGDLASWRRSSRRPPSGSRSRRWRSPGRSRRRRWRPRRRSSRGRRSPRRRDGRRSWTTSRSCP